MALKLISNSTPYLLSELEIGSGLLITQDANGREKLDYNPASGLTQEQADARYVLKTGDVMTGNLTAPSFGIAGVIRMTAPDNYTVIWNSADAVSLYLGNAADPANYYDNTTHVFRNRGATTTLATLSASAFNSAVPLQQAGNQVLHAGNYQTYGIAPSQFQAGNVDVSFLFRVKQVLNGGQWLSTDGDAYSRLWTPGVLISGPYGGTYGPALTYLAKLVAGAWQGIAGGTAIALTLSEGRFVISTAPATADVALTWSDRLVATTSGGTLYGEWIVSGRIQSYGTATSVEHLFRYSDGTVRGYIYSSASGFGFLTKASEWAVRVNTDTAGVAPGGTLYGEWSAQNANVCLIARATGTYSSLRWYTGTSTLRAAAEAAADGWHLYNWTGTAWVEAIHAQTTAVEIPTFIRARGWYNTPTGALGDLALEIGTSGGQGYIYCYNRNTGAYAPINIGGGPQPGYLHGIWTTTSHHYATGLVFSTGSSTACGFVAKMDNVAGSERLFAGAETTWLGSGTSTNAAVSAYNGSIRFFTNGTATLRAEITNVGGTLVGLWYNTERISFGGIADGRINSGTTSFAINDAANTVNLFYITNAGAAKFFYALAVRGTTVNRNTLRLAALPTLDVDADTYGGFLYCEATSVDVSIVTTAARYWDGVYIDTPTLTATAARTITRAAALTIAGPPIADLNVTITDRWSLYVASGASVFVDVYRRLSGVNHLVPAVQWGTADPTGSAPTGTIYIKHL